MQIPADKGLDHTFQLLTEGYCFLHNRFDKYNSEIIETTLLGKKMICMVGRDAVELFYDSSRFTRIGAIPKRVQKTLFGENGIQTMEGKQHSALKHLFLSMMSEEGLQYIHKLTVEQWNAQASKWNKGERIILFDEAEEVLCRVACIWAGVPLKECEVSKRAYDLGALIDALGGVGPRYQEGRKARKRTEDWIKNILSEFRNGQFKSVGKAIEKIATYKDANGKLLDLQSAAVELINVLRPIVAVARFVVFSALALHDHPEYEDKLSNATDSELEMFAQEVRRYYPFAPFLGAKARTDFEWKGYSFHEGDTVLIDLYGTNHDPTIWQSPNEFKPERFIDEKIDLYNFVPQGGGDPARGHRCPGEGLTLSIMKATLSFLVNDLDYVVVKDQDLSINFVRMPTLPASRMVLEIR
ncbi:MULTISPECIES: cytochrome P450 [Sporosarcina]|uniref:Cytochrome P450 n=1 Tax=Sporosarcina contaminans TaxID=633403 RepID=A0ABW3TZJ2_9BACL